MCRNSDTRIYRWRPALLALLTLSACGGGSGGDGYECTGEADCQVDCWQLDNGTTVNAPPPEPADPPHAQVRLLDGPAEIAPRERFSVTLTTDFADAASLTGAVFAVADAPRYIRIAQPYDPGTDEMVISGSYTCTSQEPQAVLVIAIALQEASGEVGRYTRWAIRFAGSCGPDQEGEQRCDTDALDPYLFICDSGTWEHQHCQEVCDEQFGEGQTLPWGCEYSAEAEKDVCVCSPI